VKNDFFLHIGFGKTGTSALQTFFAQNTSKFSDLGLDYPDTPHTELAKRGIITPGNGPIQYDNILPYTFSNKAISSPSFNSISNKERLGIFLRSLETNNDVLYSGEEIICVIRRHPFNVVEGMDYESRSQRAIKVDRGLRGNGPCRQGLPHMRNFPTNTKKMAAKIQSTRPCRLGEPQSETQPVSRPQGFRAA